MTTYTAKRAHAAVKRGAAWLDKQCPRWFEEIDLGLLDLADPEVCVLGQTSACLLEEEPTFDRYGTVLEHYAEGVPQTWAVNRGFDVLCTTPLSLGCPNSENTARYEMLTIAWREYIRERLAVPA